MSDLTSQCDAPRVTRDETRNKRANDARRARPYRRRKQLGLMARTVRIKLWHNPPPSLCCRTLLKIADKFTVAMEAVGNKINCWTRACSQVVASFGRCTSFVAGFTGRSHAQLFPCFQTHPELIVFQGKKLG